MAEYYVATTGSDTTGDGSSANPWATINKARATISTTANHEVFIASGTYDEVYIGLKGPSAGYTWIFQAQGAVTIRVSASSSQVYCFGSLGSGEQQWLGASASSKMVFDAANSPKGSSSYIFYESVDSARSLVFEDCEAYGNATLIGGTGGPEYATFRRCAFYNTTSYLGYFKSAGLTFESCFFYYCTSISASLNDNGVSLSLKNCTVISTAVQDTGTGGTPLVTLLNNIFQDSVINLSGINSLVQGGNVYWRTTALPEPRTSAYYTYPQFTGGTISSTAVDCLWIDPDFDTTGPELSSTSLCIGRGIAGGVSTDLYGESFGLNTAGCHAPSGGTKQYLTPTDNHWMLVGDSWTYGTGATSESTRYGNVLEATLTGKTFRKMPGDTSRHCGVSGMFAQASVLMAHELAQAYTPDTVVFIGGVNDLNGAKSTDTVADTIKFGLSNLAGLYDGSVDVIYGGTQIQDADATTPNVSGAETVELAVHSYWSGIGNKSARLTYNIQLESGWNSDSVPPGLYSADDLHLNNAGHAWLAALIAAQASSSPVFFIGSTPINEAYIGDTPITEIYLGATKIWP